MISKHVRCMPKNDNFGRLADYITARSIAQEIEYGREYTAQPYFGEHENIAGKRMRGLSELGLVHRTLGKGEERQSEGILSFDARSNYQSHEGLRWNGNKPSSDKCLISWTNGCWSQNDYDLAKQEVVETQAMNTRTTKEKTYHLIISFRPEDQDKLTPENFKAIEERFAEALGLAEHQRICGVHVNTENTHMHVAYNLIHPEKLTRVEPWRDYIARDKLCREIEKEYGLAVDNGRIKNKTPELGDKAASFEARSGYESFESFVRSQGNDIIAELEQAATWEDVHSIFAKHGMEVATRGAGLVIKERHGKQRAKASTAHRALSLKKLEARFGKFEKPRRSLPPAEVSYDTKPIQRQADQNRLWPEYQEAKKAHKAELEAIKEKWRTYREDLKKQVLGRKSRAYLLQLSRQREAEQKHALEMKSPGNWIAFLQEKARAGDENALAILRSRHEEVVPERAQDEKDVQAELLAKKTAILENRQINAKTKKRLTSQAIMESLVTGAKAAISRHGHLIYTLPNGEKICDSGKAISFSEGARPEALAYMSAKWHIKRVERSHEGKSVYVLPDGQKIKDIGQRQFVRPEARRARERNQGIDR